MSAAEHPPLSRLSLNIGVTGHRPKDLADASLDTLREKIREVLELIRDFAGNLTGVENYYSNPQKPVLRVISPLAEGADRLVAYQALALGFELQCPLPFDRLEYARDFDSEASALEFEYLLRHKNTTAVLELDGARDREADSYLAAGRVVLSQSDVLLAVWNGEVRNKKGGTSQIVAEAKQRNLATVWINSQAPHDVYLRISDSKWSPWAVGSGSLVMRLEALLRPPARSKEDEETATLADSYFSETQPVYNGGWLWLPFRNLCAEGKWTSPSFVLPNFNQSGREDWKEVAEDSGVFSPETKQIMNAAHLFEHYGWADGLAGYYGNLYRSAFVVNYLLGAIAVFFAFLHFAFKDVHAAFDWVFTIFELAALVLIAIIYRFGIKRGWHERWVDYRLLAEYLRQLFFLTPLGPGELSAPHLPAHMAAGDPRTTWMHWHYRSVRRDIGMIRAQFSGAYLESIRTLLTGKSLIGGQVEYHEKNARRFEALDKRFVRRIKFLFFLAVLAAASALVPVEWIRELLHPPAWWTSHRLVFGVTVAIALIATVFPAVGAALAGIRSQGEFERVKKRSKAMHHWLKHIADRLEAPATPGNSPISSEVLSTIVAEAGQLMVDELLDWRIVFKDRPLPEPE